jgi:hypothetical protein
MVDWRGCKHQNLDEKLVMANTPYGAVKTGAKASRLAHQAR